MRQLLWLAMAMSFLLAACQMGKSAQMNPSELEEGEDSNEPWDLSQDADSGKLNF